MIIRTLDQLAVELEGEVVGDGSTVIKGVAGIREAMPGDITFLANARYESYVTETRASAVICSREPRFAAIPLLRVENPYLAFQKAVRVFRPDPYRAPPGIHPSAVVSPQATIGEGASIGAHCVIEHGATIGARAVLLPGCYVGPLAAIGDETFLYANVVVREECVIGSRCVLHPGVVVGSDGFGFAFDAGRYHKVPQVGNVIIGDDVEIGANTTIDRATTDSTRIGDGTKIDNLVQIGHNVGDRKALHHRRPGRDLGQHPSRGPRHARRPVRRHRPRPHRRARHGGRGERRYQVDPAGEVWSGFPAAPHGMWKRLTAMVQKLPQLFQKTRALEDRVEKLEQQKEREEVG
jgi:UDP-3-O-[3-hydroxymyristoyl] glucosamine N-acyltransferase